MKANQLMIGDWVMINPISYYQVEQIRMEFGELRIYLKSTEVFATENEIMPIPLTPEILEKNGWVRTKYCYGRDCMEIHGADELPEGVDNALSMARWSIDKNFQYHFLDLYMWKGSVMQHNVHYVHQLQHALRLCGIEKEFEL